MATNANSTDVTIMVSPATIKRLRLCVDTVAGYGFREGQDGYRAVEELSRFVNSMERKLSTYGRCPHCGKDVVARERRPDGNDRCEGGHIYPSSASV